MLKISFYWNSQTFRSTYTSYYLFLYNPFLDNAVSKGHLICHEYADFIAISSFLHQLPNPSLTWMFLEDLRASIGLRCLFIRFHNLDLKPGFEFPIWNLFWPIYRFGNFIIVEKFSYGNLLVCMYVFIKVSLVRVLF